MKILSILILSLLSQSAFATDSSRRLMWWELPRALKADKKPYFEALNKYRRNTAEGSVLADHLTAIVLCEIPASFAEKDCPRWKKQITNRLLDPNEEVTLAKFSKSTNGRFILRAFAGMLEGSKKTLNSSQHSKLDALLAKLGSLVASSEISEDQWRDLIVLIESTPEIWIEISRDASLKSYDRFFQELKIWLREKSTDTTLAFIDQGQAFPLPGTYRNRRGDRLAGGFCRIEKNALHCEGDTKIGKPPLFTDLQQVVRGTDVFCALDDKEVKCWFHSTNYESERPRNVYVNPPEGIKNPYFITANGFKFCVLDEEGLKCWSSLSGNKVGPNDRPKVTHILATDMNYEMVAVVGADNSSRATYCATGDDRIRCWEHDVDYRDPKEKGIGVKLQNPRTIFAMANGFCALDDEGQKCWSGFYHQSIPLERARHLAVGFYHACVLIDGAVKCSPWGEAADIFGQSSPPLELKTVRSLVAGGDTTCALDDDGWSCWGIYRSGKALLPKKLYNPRLFSAGSGASFALDDEGIKAWGSYDRSFSRFGWQNIKLISSYGDGHFYSTDSEIYRNGQLLLSGLKNIKEVESDGHATYVVDSQGLTKYWLNDVRRLSEANHNPRAISIGSGALFLCYIEGTEFPELVCKGDNLYIPVKFSRVSALAVADTYVCVNDVEFMCWSVRGGGRKAIKDLTIRNLKKLEGAGGQGSLMCALDDDGVKCWDWETKALIPVPVLKNPRDISVGAGHACALDDEGVKCWGDNKYGQASPPESVITK